MSNSIPGRGKQRKNGQDLNTGVMHMGGGQMAMPPNGATFATPTVPLTSHAPADYNMHSEQTSYSINKMPHPVVSGTSGPSLSLPAGVNIHQVPPSPYTMGRVPGTDAVPNQNMQWQNAQQQPMMQQNMGGMPTPPYMANRMPPQQRFYPQQQQPMGYMQPGYYALPSQYAQQQQPQQYAQYPPQMYDNQGYNQGYPMMQPQQPHLQQQTGVPMHAQAPPAMQQGGPQTGVAPGMPGVQPNHGGVPASGAPTYANAAGPVSVQPHPGTNTTAMQQMHQPRPNPPTAAPVQKEKKILAIVDPNTNETKNKKEIDAAVRKEEDAPKAEKDDSKGTDEMDSAAPEIKQQFAAQILEQNAKSDQAAAPAPAPAPTKRKTNVLFSPDQLKELKLEDKVAAPAAAPAVPEVEEKQQPEEVKEKEKKDSEYLPEPLPAPAYPPNYKEQPSTSPDTTVSEMPAANHEEQQAEDSHLSERTTQHEETHASSSSEKNTSNDSAICVQPATPPTKTQQPEKPTTVTVEEPVVVAAPVEEETPAAAAEAAPAAEEPEPVAAVPVEKKLEQLEITESVSQDEAEASEPSTPAPITPSISETNTALAEEEEDADKAAAAAAEELQRKKEELEAAAVKLEEDINQCDVSKGRYNRDFLYNSRDYELLFRVTPCPLDAQKLKELGVCRSLASNEPKKRGDGGQGGFMPSWGRQGGVGAPRSDRKPYQGRQSEQHNRPPRQGGSNKKLPPQIRPSIERRVESNVQLHKAENAWKGDKVAADDESDEAVKKMLLQKVRGVFNKITPTTKDALIDEFLGFNVFESPALNDVISIIFDKAVEEPKFCPLYSNLCIVQVSAELRTSPNGVSKFRNAILQRAQETFNTKTMDEFKAEKEAEIEAEADEKKKKEKQIELLEAMSKFRRRKFGNITFIGQLYLQALLSIRIIHFCISDLLKNVVEKKSNPDLEVDEESVDCAVRLMETIGKRLQEESRRQVEDPKPTPPTKGGKGAPPPPKAAPNQQAFPFDLTFTTLNDAKQHVCSRIRFMIDNLNELRAKNWVPRNTKDAGPKKLDEIKKDMEREQIANQQAQQQYERKVSRGGMGGSMGGGGGHGGNPKRTVIQRNSMEGRGTVEERRSQAHKSSTLATRNAPQKKASLSSVTSDRGGGLGGSSKSRWSGGASGGSENSKKEERNAAISTVRSFSGVAGGPRSNSQASMKEDDGANASGTATEVNSEEEREINEKKQKMEEKVTTRVLGEIKDYGEGETNLEETRDSMFSTVGNERYEKPSIECVFKGLVGAASTRKIPLEKVPMFGHVLSYCLLKKAEEKLPKEREEILKGVAEFCKDVVEKELWEDYPKIWESVAEVIINAHMPTEGLFEGAHATLVDFKDAFLAAANDDRQPYKLFVFVLKRLAEMHYTRDKDNYLEHASWVLDECEAITKKMDSGKLDKALKDTKMEFIDNLYDILRHR